MGKFLNDHGGYFMVAKYNLLDNPNQMLKNMIDYDKDNIPDSVALKVNSMLASPSFSLA